MKRCSISLVIQEQIKTTIKYNFTPTRISTNQKTTKWWEGCEEKGTVDLNSLTVQGLGIHALTAAGPGSIPGQGTKIPQTAPHWIKKKKEPSNISSANIKWKYNFGKQFGSS